MSDFEKFKEELPRKETFYSSLINRKINDEKYEHVLNVYNKFKIKTMKDYHDLYLKCDVLLLADVFEKSRNNSFKNYELVVYNGGFWRATGSGFFKFLSTLKLLKNH